MPELQIIAQKIKPNLIKLYRWAFEEIESYSLLKVSVEEAKDLIRADKAGWKTELVNGVTEYIREVSEPINHIWLDIAAKHKENNPEFMDVSKRYKLAIPGTSCLIRDPNTHSIVIAYRRKYNTCGINLLSISDEKREEFFSDAHHSFFWKVNKKYGISIEDYSQYKKWNDYMNDCFKKYTKRI